MACFFINSTSVYAACSDPAAPEVDWSGCNKSGITFTDLNLNGANLENANFRNSQFIGETDFTEANLIRADFNGASFNDGDSVVDFRGARIANINLPHNNENDWANKITFSPDQVLYNKNSDNAEFTLIQGNEYSKPNSAFGEYRWTGTTSYSFVTEIKTLTDTEYDGRINSVPKDITVNLGAYIATAEKFYGCNFSNPCSEPYRLFNLFTVPVSATPAIESTKAINAVDLISSDSDAGYNYVSQMTDSDTSPYWQLDLGQYQHIEKIIVHPHPSTEHKDKVLDAELLLSDSSFKGDDWFTEKNYDYIGRYRGMNADRAVTFEVGHSARYIRLAKAKGESQLAFAEIEIIGQLRSTSNDTPIPADETFKCGLFDEAKVVSEPSEIEACENRNPRDADSGSGDLGGLSNCNYKNNSLVGINFSGKELTNADFSGADLTNADFSGATLTNANFSGAKLIGSRLDSATAYGADFRGATFSETELTEDAADDSNVNFDRIEVSGACFSRDTWRDDGTGPFGTSGYSDDGGNNQPIIVLTNANKLFGYARQSSTDESRPANYAYELNKSSKTTADTSPWWILDIGATFDIDSIDLTFAADCTACDGKTKMFISDWTIPSNPMFNPEDGWAEIAVTTLVGEADTYTVGRTGRFIAIQADAATIGHLAISAIKATTSEGTVIPSTIRPDVFKGSSLSFSGNVLTKNTVVMADLTSYQEHLGVLGGRTLAAKSDTVIAKNLIKKLNITKRKLTSLRVATFTLKELSEAVPYNTKVKNIITKLTGPLDTFVKKSGKYLAKTTANLYLLDQLRYQPIRKKLTQLSSEINDQSRSVSSILDYLSNVNDIFQNEVSCLAQDGEIKPEYTFGVIKLEGFAAPISTVFDLESANNTLVGSDSVYQADENNSSFPIDALDGMDYKVATQIAEIDALISRLESMKSTTLPDGTRLSLDNLDTFLDEINAVLDADGFSQVIGTVNIVFNTYVNVWLIGSYSVLDILTAFNNIPLIDKFSRLAWQLLDPALDQLTSKIPNVDIAFPDIPGAIEISVLRESGSYVVVDWKLPNLDGLNLNWYNESNGFPLCTGAVDTSSIPQVPQLNLDLDADGLINGEEIINCENTLIDAVIAGEYCDDFIAGVDGEPSVTHPYYATDAYSSDTDKDGMDDGFEVRYGFNPISQNVGIDDPNADMAAASDYDNDGVLNIDEARLGLSPKLADSDGDGISDLWESYFYAQATLISTTPELYIRPALPDNTCDETYNCDGDGDSLNVVEELNYFAQTCKALYSFLNEAEDQAYDNASSANKPLVTASRLTTISPNEFVPENTTPVLCEEIRTKLINIAEGEVTYYSESMVDGFSEKEHFLVSILNNDSDGDGIRDGIEVNQSCVLDPSNAISSVDPDKDSLTSVDELILGTDLCASDSDADGISDGIEVLSGLAPKDPSDAKLDKDGDSLSNLAEYRNATSLIHVDSDFDGVNDNIDAFPLDTSESLDTDGDGIGNNADSDDDNDGVADSADAFPFDVTESEDTDGDGTGNNTDNDDDNDGVVDSADAFPLDSRESIDTDGDGIGNNADNDDDNDGVVDAEDEAPLDATIGDTQAPIFTELNTLTFEATAEKTAIDLPMPEVNDNNLNPLTLTSDYSNPLPVGEHIIRWIAIDFANNQSVAEQTVNVVDTTAPVFDDIALITLAAKGRLTDISSALTVKSYDLVDGEISPMITTETVLLTGRHEVVLTSMDKALNSVIATQPIDILPQAGLPTSLQVMAGGNYEATFALNGAAPAYPVTFNYQVLRNENVIIDAQGSLNSGIQTTFTVDIPDNVEVKDNLVLTLVEVNNATVGDMNQSRLVIVDNNVAPNLLLTLYQGEKQVTIVDPSKGLVMLKAAITDVNQSDNHDIVWRDVSGNFPELIGEFTYLLNPENLAVGVYSLQVDVSENNTQALLSVTKSIQFVVDHLAALDTRADTDNDGIVDSDEGYNDSDGDGIADYLDNDADTTRLPSVQGVEPLQTSLGLSMSLGTLASAQGIDVQGSGLSLDKLATLVDEGAAQTRDAHYELASPIYNFTVEGAIEQGESVAVVVPLAKGSSLPESAVYRKYNIKDGWHTFVEDNDNHLSSASTDENGNCPAANDDNYSQGLTAGDNCIQLFIEDGGPNDTDLSVNGAVEDPGAIAIEVQNHAPEIVLARAISIKEDTPIMIDASGSSDVEGDSLTYLWQQLSGVSIELDNTHSAQLNFISPSVSQNEVLIFELTVDDGLDTSSTTIEVTVLQVNKAPVVTINEHENSNVEGSNITLIAQASDPDGDELSYTWEKVSGPAISFDSQTNAQVSFTLPSVTGNEVVKIQVTASDGEAAATSITSIAITPKTVTPQTVAPKKKEGGGSMGWLVLVVLVSRMTRGFNLKRAA
ncbi:pentapeptide repeat-containing protein [Cognaticolwellia mytili]|uniref:pentapeptide repeat-containing protein n=1 Tax=Cognaticolwellia mytili TaxID=1888913 RepID=UPI001301AD16|nr:pentapeptide repeat-containing protein [Cognaticolwellia mytili]